MELLGSRAMTGAERARRFRSMKALREQRERDEALTEAFIGPYPDREVNIEVADFLLAGLAGVNEQAARILADFLADLPTELAELRHDLDELRKAGATPTR